MKRGDIVVAAFQGDYGKPRPALVIQSNIFDMHPSVTVLMITSKLRATPTIRLDLAPSAANGLRFPSQVMIDRCQTLAREKIGQVIGTPPAAEMAAVNRSLAVFLGLV